MADKAKTKSTRKQRGGDLLEEFRKARFRSNRDPFQTSTPPIAEDNSRQEEGEEGVRRGRPQTNTKQLVARFLDDTQVVVQWQPDQANPDKGYFYIWDARVAPFYKRESFQALKGRIQRWMGNGGMGGDAAVIPSLAGKMADSLLATYNPALPPAQVWRTPDRHGVYRPGDGLLVVKNGILDIGEAARNRRGRKALLKHTPDFFATGMAPLLYLPKSLCPTFDKYCETTFPDEGARALFLKIMGWVISGNRLFPVFVVFYGKPGTGKGTAAAILRALVGEGNHCSIALHNFADKYKIGALARYRLNMVDEAPEGSIICSNEKEQRSLVEGTLKAATGGFDARVDDDTKHVDGKGTTSRRVKAANIFCFNDPFPRFVDPALFHRLRALVFERTFRFASDENEHIGEYILAHEMSGVLNRALDGLAMLGDSCKLPEYDAGRDVVRLSRCGKAEDALNMWLEECCHVKQGGFSPSAALYENWMSWQKAFLSDDEAGNPAFNIAENAFPLAVRKAWSTVESAKVGGVRGLRGIVLKPQEAQKPQHESEAIGG